MLWDLVEGTGGRRDTWVFFAGYVCCVHVLKPLPLLVRRGNPPA